MLSIHRAMLVDAEQKFVEQVVANNHPIHVKTPVEIVQALLQGSKAPAIVHAMAAPDATYVSLNYENAELKKKEPEAVLSTYTTVAARWESQAFDIEAIFGAGENVAVFGRFTYESRTLGKAITSPFSIFAKVENGQVTSMQFMEDTFGTAATCRSGGTWKFQSDPAGGGIEV